LLANVAWLLARWGRRVLCLDWDLEAPGLYRYLAPSAPRRAGILDLVLALPGEEGEPLPAWKEMLEEVSGPWMGSGCLHFIGAGRRDNAYVKALQGLRWDELSERGLEGRLELLRAEWVGSRKDAYDHVLVDSRTGFTDVGGICAAQLPDLLVLTFTATFESLEGALDVAARARRARSDMPLDRGGFDILPIPCRIHTGDEALLEAEWARRFEISLAELYRPWMDPAVAVHEYIAHLRIREQARWSFGEQMPVRAEPLDDPNCISYAFANVAGLVDSRLAKSGDVIRDRHAYLLRLAGEAGFSTPGGTTESDYDVFISYPRLFLAEAKGLAGALGRAGLRVFSDQMLPPGDNWLEALYRARERSRAFAVLLSDQPLGAGQSAEVPHIQRRMTERGVRVIPLFLSAGAVSHAPPPLADLFGLVVSEEGGWDQIAKKIARQLGKPAGPELQGARDPRVVARFLARADGTPEELASRKDPHYKIALRIDPPPVGIDEVVYLLDESYSKRRRRVRQPPTFEETISSYGDFDFVAQLLADGKPVRKLHARLSQALRDHYGERASPPVQAALERLSSR
jgi:hypothetical protein